LCGPDLQLSPLLTIKTCPNFDAYFSYGTCQVSWKRKKERKKERKGAVSFFFLITPQQWRKKTLCNMRFNYTTKIEAGI
jgi:hypothetical protein